MAEEKYQGKKQEENQENKGCLGWIGALVAILGLILTFLYGLDRPDFYLTHATAVHTVGPLVDVNVSLENHGKAGARDITIAGVDADDKIEPRLFERTDDVPSGGGTSVRISIRRVLQNRYGDSIYYIHLYYSHAFGFRHFEQVFCIESDDKQLQTPFTTPTPNWTLILTSSSAVHETQLR
jgi:hypothetical protein